MRWKDRALVLTFFAATHVAAFLGGSYLNYTPYQETHTATLNINLSGETEIDGYSIEAADTEKRETGYTYGHGSLYINKSMTLREVYKTCHHEKLHNTQPDWSHSKIYQNERDYDPTCGKLLYEALFPE